MKTKTRSLLTYILFCNSSDVIKYGYRYDSIRNGYHKNSNGTDKKRNSNGKIRNGNDKKRIDNDKN